MSQTPDLTCDQSDPFLSSCSSKTLESSKINSTLASSFYLWASCCSNCLQILFYIELDLADGLVLKSWHSALLALFKHSRAVTVPFWLHDSCSVSPSPVTSPVRCTPSAPGVSPLRVNGLCIAAESPLFSADTRRETAKRVMIFFIGNLSASATSNLLAYGLLQMSGVGGKPGWFWCVICAGHPLALPKLTRHAFFSAVQALRYNGHLHHRFWIRASMLPTRFLPKTKKLLVA